MRDGIGERVYMPEKLPYAFIKKTLKIWHWSGGWINVVSVVSWLFLVEWWAVFLAGVLIRVAFFDLVRNKFANHSLWALGTESYWDKFFTKHIGKNASKIKTIASIIILIILNILYVQL